MVISNNDQLLAKQKKVAEDLEFDLEEDHRQEQLRDAIEGAQETNACDHCLDSLDLLGWDYRGDQLDCVYRCSCGKTVTEIFTHFETRISD